MELYFKTLDHRHRRSAFSNINRASLLLAKKNENNLVPRRKESLLAEEALKVFYKRAGKRTDDEILLIMEFTKEIRFFKEYLDRGEIEIQKKCCEKMFLMKFNAGEIVLEQFSEGDKFFIILDGTVLVCIDNKNSEKASDQSYKMIKTLSRGDSFGELALLSKKPRAATIICQTDCKFAVLNQKDFEQLLKSKEELKLAHELELYSKIALFSDWQYQMLRLMYHASYSLTFRLNSTVFLEGDSCEGLFVVENGSFLVYKTVNMNIDENEMDSKVIKIAIIERGSYFGEEDIIKDRKRTYSVMALKSNSVVRIIPLNFVRKHILRNEESLRILKAGIRKKGSHFSSMISKVISQKKSQPGEKKNSKLPYFFGSNEYSNCVKSISQFVKIKSSTDPKKVEIDKEDFYKKQSQQNEIDSQKMFTQFQKQEDYHRIMKNSNSFRIRNYCKTIPKVSSLSPKTSQAKSVKAKISEFDPGLTGFPSMNDMGPIKMKSLENMNYYLGIHTSTPTRPEIASIKSSISRISSHGKKRIKGYAISHTSISTLTDEKSSLSNFLLTARIKGK